MRFALIGALGLLLGFGPSAEKPVELNAYTIGFTTCIEGRPYAFMRLDQLHDTKLAETIVVHELDHVQFILDDGGCVVHMARFFASPRDVAREAEASAHCAEAKLDARRERWSMERATMAAGLRLSNNYQALALDEAEAIALVRSYCS